MIRVAMVSYINAIPFKYGMARLSTKEVEVREENPAVCAQLFFDDKVDIALLPVGALIDQESYAVFSDYCIGSVGSVQTVCLFSDNKLEDIHTVYLDKHSRTSVLLAKLLMKEHVNHSIVYFEEETEGLTLKEGEAKLMIGDKVFREKNEYDNIIDLSAWWEKTTGLPFVFAVWVKKDYIDIKVIEEIENALSFGVNSLEHVLATIDSKIDLEHYFKHNISYVFDESKKEALALFFNKIKEYQLV